MLVFLSDFTKNNHKELLNKVNSKFSDRQYKLAYISSSTDVSRKYYMQFISDIKKFGDFSCSYYDFDQEYSADLLDEIFTSDVIFLSGGETPYFMGKITERGLVGRFQEFYSNCGTIIGVSAGSIILTESIKTGQFCGDPYILDDSVPEGINLVDFEFVAHWKNNMGFKERIEDYSSKCKHKIFACNDGDGIVVDEEGIHVYGNITIF